MTRHQQTYKKILLLGIDFILLLSSFLFANIEDVWKGLIEIYLHPSLLTTDYMEIGGAGAAFFNAFLVLLFQIGILCCLKIRITGTLIATVSLVSGFAFFGTNVLNMTPILLGTWLYAKLSDEKFEYFVMQGFLGSTLGPFSGLIAFDLDIIFPLNFLLAIAMGILIGFLIPVLSSAGLRFHQGYTLYNIGFISGIIGMVLLAFFRMFSISVEPVSHLSENNEYILPLILIIIFVLTIAFGFLIHRKEDTKYLDLLRETGRLVIDFDTVYGSGLTFINMGLMGLISVIYVFIIGAPFNGPVIGGIFSVYAFAAMGKHPKNSIPVMIGVGIGTLLSHTFEPNSTSAAVTALFATTLAPLSGEFGFVIGIISGFCHSALVSEVLGLHGGVNLYNNGFASGFVAAAMTPICMYFRELKEKKNEKTS